VRQDGAERSPESGQSADCQIVESTIDCRLVYARSDLLSEQNVVRKVDVCVCRRGTSCGQCASTTLMGRATFAHRPQCPHSPYGSAVSWRLVLRV